MKRIFLFVGLMALVGHTHAQGLTPMPIPCTEPKIYTPGFAPGTHPMLNIGGYNCIDMFGPLLYGGPNIIDRGYTDMVAGEYIELGPGTDIGGFTPTDSLPPYVDPYYFDARIGHNDFEVVWFEPNSTPGDVGQYEKLELGVKLPGNLATKTSRFVDNTSGDKINPFNPDSINVEADFYFMEDKYYIQSGLFTKKVYGFYYKEFVRNFGTHGWDEDTTSYRFRIRFAPTEIGNWLVKIKIYSTDGNYEVLPIYFTCVSSSNKGYVVNNNTTTNDNRKFLYFSKEQEPFFAIGNNFNWTDTGPTYWNLESDDYLQMEEWLDQLSTFGGNYTQIGMMARQYGIEWTDGEYNMLNNYSKRLTNAWEFDQVLKSAKEKGIYINVHNELHDEFQTESYLISNGFEHHLNSSWDRNPYNSDNQNKIPGIYDPIDFLYNGTARDTYKKKLRYIISRWGYSTSIMLWELVSEIDNMLIEHDYHTNSSTRAHLKSWF